MRTNKAVQKKQEPTWEEWVAPSQAVGLVAASDMHDAIAYRAYSYWEARGFQGGSPEEDWLRAQAEIRLEHRTDGIMRLDRTHLQ